MILVLPVPPSINATYKRNSRSFYKSAEATSWEETAGWLLKKQWKRKPLEGDLYVHFWFFFKDKRRDISSGVKILEDVLQASNVYKNDRQIVTELSDKLLDKKNPRVEIEIVEVIESDVKKSLSCPVKG